MISISIKIFPDDVSSSKGFLESPNEEGLVPEDFSNTFLLTDIMLVVNFCEDFFHRLLAHH